MYCPCCNNGINKLDEKNKFYLCARLHKFSLELEDKKRVLTVVVDPPDKCGCKKGDKFTVPDNEE